jgi:hypothetical protein
LAEALNEFREYLADPGSYEPIADGTKVVPFQRRVNQGDEFHDATERLVKDAGKEFDVLRRMRDELRVQLHLASGEAKAQWDRLDDRWCILESLTLVDAGSCRHA